MGGAQSDLLVASELLKNAEQDYCLSGPLMDEPQSPKRQHLPTERVGADRPAPPQWYVPAWRACTCPVCVCLRVCVLGHSQTGLFVPLAQLEL